MAYFIEGISLFRLLEIPMNDASFALYLNSQLRLKEDYRLTNDGLHGFVEWLNPDGLFLEHRDSLVATYRSKEKEYCYIEQYLLDPPIERKTSFLSRIKNSIINLFKRGE